MARYRRYVDLSVEEAAKRRLRRIADTHDTVAVCFSGGKDSLAVLNLWKEVNEGRKVNVIFRDPELMPSSVIDFVRGYAEQPWVDMQWLAVPAHGSKYILGKLHSYVRWDPARKWMRQPPPYAITDASQVPGTRFPAGYVFSGGAEMDELAAARYRGKIAYLTGVRADESILRFQAVCAKQNQPYISASPVPGVSMGKPIYDWSEDDVFRYFFEKGIRYCPLYDYQNLAREGFRIAPPLTPENAKHLASWREIDQPFYAQLTEMFPDVIVQARYWEEFGTEAVIDKHGDTMEQVEAYVKGMYSGDPRVLKVALGQLKKAKRNNQLQPEAYPPHHILRHFVNGGFKRNMMPYWSSSQQKRVERVKGRQG